MLCTPYGRLRVMSVDQAFLRLYEIIVRLRSPEGCPWDREQTAVSLRRHLIEETYEAVDAIDSGDSEHVAEELGDLTLLVLMIARISEELSLFSVESVLERISDKLVRRHPHVFGESIAATPDDVVRQWQEIKESQEGRSPRHGVLGGVSRGQPPLDRANELQKAAAKVGFDWERIEDVIAKLNEESTELQDVLRSAADSSVDSELYQAMVEEEVGDLLFTAVNLSRFLGIDPSVALNRTNRKFLERFRHVESEMATRGMELNKQNAAVMNEIWDTLRDTQPS